MPNLYEVYSNYSRVLHDLFAGNGLKSLPKYSFSAGVGSDITSKYFTGIPEYLFFFLKRRNIEFSFTAIIAIRIYLSGLSFGLMCLHFKNKEKYIIPGALIYAFNGFTLYYGLRHYSFLIPVVVLPAMVIGIENVLKRKSPLIYILAVFYTAWTDYYFLYMDTLFIAIYVIAYWISKKRSIKKYASDFLLIVGYYCMGVMMAAVSLLTKIGKFFLSSRGDTQTSESGSMFFYGSGWIRQMLIRMFSPYTTGSYSQHYMLYAVSPVIIIAVVALFVIKTQKMTRLRILTVVGFIFLSFPVFGYIFSGFSSQVNRWSYGFVLLLCYVFVKILPGFVENHKNILLISFGLFLAGLLVMILDDDVREKSTMIGMGVFLASVIILFIVCRISIARGNGKLFPYCICTLTALSVSITGFMIFSRMCGNFATQFLKYGQWNSQYNESLYYSALTINDDSFYRVEVDWISQNTANAPKIFEAYGTSIYDSVTDRNVLNYNNEMLNSSQLTSANFYGYDARSILDHISGVRYYITDRVGMNIPYGYSFYYTVNTPEGKEQYVYISDYPVSMGYVFPNAFCEEQLENYSALQKQELLLDGVIVSGEDLPSYPFSSPTTSNIVQLPVSNIVTSSARISGQMIYAGEENATCDLYFEAPPNSEIYLQILGLNIDNLNEGSISVRYNSERANGFIWALYSKDKYRLEDYRDYLIYLGNTSEGPVTDARLTLPYTGEYIFDDLSIIAVNRDGLVEQYAALNDDSLENVVIDYDRIDADLDSSRDGILLLNVPYSENWTVKIDGVEADTFVADYMWTGVQISRGVHHITMIYSKSIFSIGIFLSILSIMVNVILLSIMRKRHVF